MSSTPCDLKTSNNSHMLWLDYCVHGSGQCHCVSVFVLFFLASMTMVAIAFTRCWNPLDFGKTLKLQIVHFSYIFRQLCGSVWNYYSCSPAISHTYHGWYSTLPLCVSENSLEPLIFFGRLWSLEIGHFSYILTVICKLTVIWSLTLIHIQCESSVCSTKMAAKHAKLDY